MRTRAQKTGFLQQPALMNDANFPQIHYRRGGNGEFQPRLRGFSIRVKTVVVCIDVHRMSFQEVADEYDLPLEMVTQAMAFYEAHRLEIDTDIEADRQFAMEAGYG